MSSTLTNLTHKQLFLTDFQIKGKEILITNPDLLNQVRKVLRLQKGDTIYVQKERMRYEVEIKDRDDKTMTGTIINKIDQMEDSERETGMIIGMPNKWDKVELIVQKLTEIGMNDIIFWPSERSVIRTWNKNKEERLLKIAREAVEQSRGWTMPTVTFVTDIKEILKDKKVIVFDKTENEKRETGNVQRAPLTVETFGLVGPEGGLTERDYEALKGIEYEVHGLGDTMLRTETAAIVAGWIVKNDQL